MLVAMLLSQHRISSFRTSISWHPLGMRCNGHFRITWAVVRSNVPHLQIDVGARSHFSLQLPKNGKYMGADRQSIRLD